MRFLLLLLLLPVTYSLTINATGYTPDGVSYVVSREINEMDNIIERCLDASFGELDSMVTLMTTRTSNIMIHNLVQCLLTKHNYRTSTSNEFTMLELLIELHHLFAQQETTNIEIKLLTTNTTEALVMELENINKQTQYLKNTLVDSIKQSLSDVIGRGKEILNFASKKENYLEEADSMISLKFEDISKIYNHFNTEYINFQTRLQNIKDDISLNRTAFDNAKTLFKANIISHYLEVSGVLNTTAYLNTLYDAYECVGDNRTTCIYPNAVSVHLETCTRPAVIFGENGEFLSFNSLIQVSEEAMCSADTTCIDTEDSQWSALTTIWTSSASASTDRWICFNFEKYGSNIQSSKSHLRATSTDVIKARKIAAFIGTQIKNNQPINVNSPDIQSEFSSFGITSLPSYDANKKIMADVLVDDDPSATCDTSKCNIRIDVCCMKSDTLLFLFEKNGRNQNVRYESKMVTHDPYRYNPTNKTIATEIAKAAALEGEMQIEGGLAVQNVLERLEPGCGSPKVCKKFVSDAVDCESVEDRSDPCHADELFVPDRTINSETVYTTSAIGNPSPIGIDSYSPDTSLCTELRSKTTSNIFACEQYILEELYYTVSGYTKNQFIFGHYDEHNTCRLYECTKKTFLENKAGDTGQLIPLRIENNRTVVIDIAVEGNSATNSYAIPCPVDFNEQCTSCSDDWHAANASRATWTEAQHTASTGPLWGVCQTNSKRYQKSSDTFDYCTKTKSKPCQLVHVTSATFVKTTGQLTVTWDNSTTTDYPSGQYLTIKHGNVYETIIDGSSEKVINSTTPPDIHLYRSDASGKDLGDYLARVCHKHIGDYGEYPVQVEENPQCVQNAGRERQLFNITSDCVVDPNDTFENDMCLVNEFDTSVNQTEGEQYKDLIQIKLPYDGSNPYNGCGEGVSQTCYVCGNGHHNKDNTGDVAKQCEPCPAGTESGPFNNNNGRECVACDGVNTYQDEEGGASCKVVDTCADGEYVTQTPLSTRNRLCQACPAGSVSSGTNQASCTACDGVNEYQDQSGQTSCKTVSSCPKGQGVTQNATTISDTVCQPCISGSTYSDVDSKTASCQAVNVCDGSEAEAEPPTAQSDRECQCAAGHYVYVDVNTATESCQPCPSGTYQPSANALETCPNTWATCAAGTYISVHGTTTSDRTCTPCASGSFTDTSNQESCTAYTDCGSDRYVSVDGTTTTDQTCADKKADGSVCSAGQECTSGSCDSGTCVTSCNDNTDCAASQYCDGVSGFCKDKVGQDESCGITDECQSGLFCDPNNANCAIICDAENQEHPCNGDEDCCSDQNYECGNSGMCVSVPSSPSTYLNIEAGGRHTCAISNENKLWCWGRNDHGQLGDDTTTTRSTPLQVTTSTGLTNIYHVSLGGYHTCAIKDDNSLWCWGKNNYGQLGDGSTTSTHTPLQIDSITNVRSISATSGHTCAITNSDSLYCWGYNAYGQLGNGNTNDQSVPQLILENVQSVSASYQHTCAIKTDSSLWCWGRNHYGQLGINNQNSQTVPVNTGSSFLSIDGGTGHTCGVKSDYSAYGWGYSRYGRMCKAEQEIGWTYTYTKYLIPERCDSPNNGNDNVMIASGSIHSCILKSSGKVRCFGLGDDGEIGIGSTTSTNNAGSTGTVHYSNGNEVVNAAYITAGNEHTCILDTEGKAYCWGYNYNGQLGNGDDSRSDQTRAVAVI